MAYMDAMDYDRAELQLKEALKKNKYSYPGTKILCRINITLFFVLMAMVFSAAAGRALLLQGIDAPANAQAAAQQLTRTQELKADRGVILDRNGQVLLPRPSRPSR